MKTNKKLQRKMFEMAKTAIPGRLVTVEEVLGYPPEEVLFNGRHLITEELVDGKMIGWEDFQIKGVTLKGKEHFMRPSKRVRWFIVEVVFAVVVGLLIGKCS